VSPQPETLKKAAIRIKAARQHLRASIDAGREMEKAIPKSPPQMVEFLRMRLRAGNEIVANLDAAVLKIHDRLAAGQYPQLSDCAVASTAFGDLFGRFRENALFHSMEGF